MRIVIAALFCFSLFARGQDLPELSSQIVETDAEKDGEVDRQVETFFRGGEEILVEIRQKDADGVFRVEMRTFKVDGKIVFIEADPDGDGILNHYTMFADHEGDLGVEVFSLGKDGRATPTTSLEIAAHRLHYKKLFEFLERESQVDDTSKEEQQIVEPPEEADDGPSDQE